MVGERQRATLGLDVNLRFGEGESYIGFGWQSIVKGKGITFFVLFFFFFFFLNCASVKNGEGCFRFIYIYICIYIYI